MMKIVVAIVIVLILVIILKRYSVENLEADATTVANQEGKGVNQYATDGSFIPEDKVAFAPEVSYKMIPINQNEQDNPKKCSVNIYSPIKNNFMSKIYPRSEMSVITNTDLPDPINMGYFAKYGGMIIDPRVTYELVNEETLETALNKAIIDSKCGAVAYDKKRGAALYYAYMNFGNKDIGTLRAAEDYDTYIKI